MSEDKIYQDQNITFSGKNKRIGIIAARFNSFIVDRLISAAEETLLNHEVSKDNIEIFKVPGAFELPLSAQKAASTGRFDALICFGCVIRGDTPHFDYVCNEASRGIQDVSLHFDMPVMFGLLTTDNNEQAEARVTGDDNKGIEIALGALDMLSVIDAIEQHES